MNSQGHWNFDGDFQDEALGFIYLITNNLDGRKYVGKKQMTCVKKLPPLKGRVNKRHVERQTNWKTYTGSSDALNAEIALHSVQNFSFDILSFHQSKSCLAYFEAKEIIDRNALRSADYYNLELRVRVSARNLS